MDGPSKQHNCHSAFLYISNKSGLSFNYYKYQVVDRPGYGNWHLVSPI